MARSILAVLDSRHVVIDDELRERILACRDLDTLEAWLARAAQASPGEDFLAGED